MSKQDILQSFNSKVNPFKVVYGDLVAMAKAGQFDVIGHGCNCHCNMGAGIAKTIRLTFPPAFRADEQTKKSDRSKMGGYSSAVIGPLTVVNMYTQYDYTRTKVDIEYDALKKCLEKMAVEFHGKRIGLPLIGNGLAGGSWDVIKEVIGEALKGEDVTVVVFNKGAKGLDSSEQLDIFGRH